jgi:hypothetical protein
VSGPFAVCVMSSDAQAATVEPSLERAIRRAVRALRHVGASTFASGLPANPASFELDGRKSYSVILDDVALTISLAWLLVRPDEKSWPDPVIVAIRARGELRHPMLAPDRKRAELWAQTLIERGITEERLLLLSATDLRNVGRTFGTMASVPAAASDETPVEKVVQRALATRAIAA